MCQDDKPRILLFCKLRLARLLIDTRSNDKSLNPAGLRFVKKYCPIFRWEHVALK